MNRIHKLFRKSKGNILSVYFTAGYPALNDTVRIIQYLEKYGAGMIEIGMPFSDPVADGEVIQKSSQKALENGMSLKLLFTQLKGIREKINLPLILMGYYNPVYRMGLGHFLEQCAETGIDGIILPDYPPEEYETMHLSIFRKYGISNILLVTPQTPEERIREIDRISDGFIYMVSSYATTGMGKEFSKEQEEYFSRLKGMNLKNPLVAGFGISDRRNFETACRYGDGAITGTSFIKAISADGPMEEKIRKFMQEMGVSKS